MSRHQQSEPHPLPARGPEQWLPDAAAETLLVTGTDVLRSEVERIVAAAGGRLRTVRDVQEAAPFWDTSAAVLVGSDIIDLPLRRRAPAVLVGMDGEGDGRGHSLWHLAALIGAERVAVLPQAATWLAEYLSRSRSPEAGGHVLGIIGGCGGAGATTAAVWVAQAAARQGVRVLLVDGDPWGGGLELALAAEDVNGLRWPDLAGAIGSIDPYQLADALPEAGGFSFLSWPGSREAPAGLDAGPVSAVLDAARRAFDLVVVDIGRGQEMLRAFAWECDELVLLAPAQLRAAVAAARLAEELPPVETGLVVRAKPGAALDEFRFAEAVGLRLHSIMPEVRGLTAATELGRLLESGQQRSVRQFAESVIDLSAGNFP